MISRIFLSFIPFLFLAPLIPAADFQAGAAKVDITPPFAYTMWGYAARHDAPSTGTLDPLHARALVLAAGKERLAFVSLDLGRAPPRHITAAIRAGVLREAGVQHIFLVASHTHHAPVLELDNYPTPKNSYLRQLEEKLAAVIIEAAKKLRPARLGIASEQVELNRNRHSRLADKPVDRELLVLRVEDLQGKPIAHAVNFAAHPTMLPASLRKFSADYPGALAQRVEQETGAPCLFLQGAAGDLSVNAGEANTPQKFGKLLGDRVLARSKAIQGKVDKSPSIQVKEEDFRFGKRFDLAEPAIRTAYEVAFFKGIVDFYEREYREGIRPHLTVALLNGNIGLVGVSGEFFCSHSLNLKRRARLPNLLFLGYCNDYQQYFPTIEGASEGGYGAAPMMSPVEVGAGERMMDRALILLYQLRGKLKTLGLEKPALPNK